MRMWQTGSASGLARIGMAKAKLASEAARAPITLKAKGSEELAWAGDQPSCLSM